MVDELCAGFLYKVDPVRTQLMQTVCWHILWHGKECSVIDPHCAVDVPEVSLNGSSDDAQMPDNTSSLIRFQPLENFHLGRFMLIFKYVPRNADQIGHLGDQLVGAILVYDFVFIGDSSTNSLLDFHVRLPLCFVVCSRKALVKASKFSKVFCAVFDGEGCPRNIMVSLCWRISQSSVNNADNPCIRKVADQSANTLFELDYHFRDAHIHQRIFRDILFNCGLRTSELLKLRMCDVDLKENVFTILDTKFHKNRLVPFSDSVSEALTQYLEMFPPQFSDSLIFPSSSPRSNGGRYGNSWLQTQFHQLLRMAGIPYNGPGKGPRLHDIRHTFAVHCLNNWVLSGEDLTAALPVLSRYLGHNGLTGTQKYLQLTAQMYPDIVAKLEVQFGGLIPQMEVSDENI